MHPEVPRQSPQQSSFVSACSFFMSPPTRPVLVCHSHSELGGTGVGGGAGVGDGTGGSGILLQMDSSERDFATESSQVEKFARIATSTSGYLSLTSFLSPRSASRS